MERKSAQQTPKGLEIPVPTREDFDRFIDRVVGADAQQLGHKDPDATDPPPEQSAP